MGSEFDLPTDIFSLGVILAEIAARRLADDTHFARSAPLFTIDTDEVRRLANPGCPPEFIQLAIDCISEEPAARPTTLVILDRLRAIEAEVLARPEEAEVHTGSIKFMTGNRRHPAAPRIPSFGEGIGKGIRTSSIQEPQLSEDSDDELSDAVSRLESVTVVENGIPLTSRIPDNGSGDSQQPLLAAESSYSNYSTSVIRGHSQQPTYSTISPLSSILTIRASPVIPNPPPNRPLPTEPEGPSTFSIASYYTASEVEDASSIAAATEGGSSLAPALVHRFTLVKPGTIFTKRSRPSSPSGGANAHASSSTTTGGWSALDFFFASGLLPGGGGGAKCDICAKRLGRKAALECDDCGLRAHIKCGEVAPRDCALRASSSSSILTRVSSAPYPIAPLKANKSKSPSPFSHR
jgi:LIM domain kinase 1